MINTNNASMLPSSSSSAATNAQSPTLKTYFKTPEGRYRLHYEKTHPPGLLHYAHGRTLTQEIYTLVTLASLKDKPTQTPLSTSSSMSVSSGVRSAAARFLGGGNGSRALSFGGGNGGSKSVNVSSRVGSLASSSSNSGMSTSNFDGKGTYLVFNVGDAIFISDLNSPDKEPIKCINFGNSNPVCHAFDPDARDGHDLLIGLASGDVYSASIRQQLQDSGKKLVGAQHYNKDGCVDNSRCTSIAWVPNGDGAFVVAHADGNFYVYEKNKDGSGDPSFSVIKDQTQFSVAHARYSKNPVARWHICQGSINSVAFSTEGTYIATVGRDGYLRVFDYNNEQLICGGKSYYGALLCCAWSKDGKYILTGGEDDLVQVWSMEDRKVVAWGEGHNSWGGRSAELLLIPSGHLQIQTTQVKTLCSDLVLLDRTHNCFCGTWRWTRLLCHYAEHLVVLPHSAVVASHLIGTVLIHWVLCNLLLACEMFQSSPRWLRIVFTPNLSLVCYLLRNPLLLCAGRDTLRSGQDLGFLKANQTTLILC
ncbi:uncharacterized protein LOC127788387 isoform X3 [Diospyros lotus]|uniref:uncharacterized protein LOC127788387 isoform X3 n=1 Tax=Diospyros lotus TaxID=55363 RepID=UPI0022560B17|nr:uncharacterized protein LOC127788387 isoform X3 [Diospyros lotus]